MRFGKEHIGKLFQSDLGHCSTVTIEDETYCKFRGQKSVSKDDVLLYLGSRVLRHGNRTEGGTNSHLFLNGDVVIAISWWLADSSPDIEATTTTQEQESNSSCLPPEHE